MYCSFLTYITCYVAYFRFFLCICNMYYVHFGYISNYVTNLFCYILGYIEVSVYYINCYITCYITYCLGVLKNYIAML